MTKGLESVTSVGDVLSSDDVEYNEGKTELTELRGDFSFRHMAYSYPGSPEPVLRDISVDVRKGQTIAIVGESGSGKSVTSKAIMGISAVNAIYEGGEILYDGQDLVRIPEEEMHKLRGDKIAMIFQDPLSSLNPIMRIGRQITEAMLLKNKANRKEGRVTFNKQLGALSNMMVEALDEKLDGICLRSKYRIRMYNYDPRFLKLEKKEKLGSLTRKTAETILLRECPGRHFCVVHVGQLFESAAARQQLLESRLERIEVEGLAQPLACCQQLVVGQNLPSGVLPFFRAILLGDFLQQSQRTVLSGETIKF
jgi:ABC-type dipeptide/oligopeptide/nickel transport system ATPase component